MGGQHDRCRYSILSSVDAAGPLLVLTIRHHSPYIRVVHRTCDGQEATGPQRKRRGPARGLGAQSPPQAVTASEFFDSEFFDARDLVQVKYEMLRRVRHDGSTVSDAAAAFGLSRPSFYEANAAYEHAGIPGLLPKRPGPRRAHKLTEAVVERLEEAVAADASISSTDLAALVLSEFGVRVHPRSVERALARRPKGERGSTR